MAGLKGQARWPGSAARLRRNSARLASEVEFVGSGSVIDLNNGILVVNLTASGGLENDGDSLGIDLDTDSLLLLAAGGLSVDEDELYRRHQVWG